MDIAEIKTGRGWIRLTDKVLEAVARSVCLKVPGVAGMEPRFHGSIPSMIVNTDTDGAHVAVRDGRLEVELYIWVYHGVRAPEIALHVQEAVKEALVQTSGFPVSHVNLFIERIVFKKGDA